MFNFIYPYIPIYAADDDSDEKAPGGTLLQPLIDLISAVGEGVIWIIQSQVLGMSTSNIHIDQGDNGGIVGAIVGIGATAISWVFTPLTFGGSLLVGLGTGFVAGSLVGKAFPDDFYLPIYKISPQEIFSDQIPALHINFINPKTYDSEGEEGSIFGINVYNSAKVLGPQISKWYVAIRNLVLVGLMVVLLYIGIRIVISSTSGEKAKYKEHIKDWLVAVVLVVFMHYIMAFALTLTEYITNILNGQNYPVAIEFDKDQVKEIEKQSGVEVPKAADGNYYYYTNLMGYARLQQQMDTRDDDGNTQFTWSYIGYTIIYLVLVIYTVMFLIIYFKRVIYMAFLTIIAPLVALTYPIDKISDGQAQAFNMWLKEYMYNLLLQPFHLLLYTLLVGSVIDLATHNMIYAIVALGFLVPAEQLLRKFFGFEKASTTGSIVGGVVGGSIAMGAINKLGKIGLGSSKSRGSNNSGDEKNEGGNSNRIRTPNSGLGTNDDLITKGFGGGVLPTQDSKKDINIQGEEQADTAEGEQQTIFGRSPGNNISLRLQERTLDGRERTQENETENKANQDVFNPYSDFELGQPFRKWGNKKIENSKIRLNNFTEAGRRRIDDWENKTPKTKFGRDVKRVTIRGARTAKAKLGTTAHYVGKGIKSAAKSAPRVVAKAALGAAVGTAGIAAGVASGDWSNVVAYGATAATIGAKLGDGVSNVASNVGGFSKDMKDDYMKRRYTSDEIKEIQNKKLDEEWKKNKEVIRLYQEKFGNSYKEAMDNAMEYRKYGITEDKAIIAAQKLKNLSDESATSAERIALAKAATMVKSDQDMENYGERLKDNGISDQKIKEVKKNIRLINKM